MPAAEAAAPTEKAVRATVSMAVQETVGEALPAAEDAIPAAEETMPAGEEGTPAVKEDHPKAAGGGKSALAKITFGLLGSSKAATAA